MPIHPVALVMGWAHSTSIWTLFLLECIVFLIVDIVFHYIFTHIAKRTHIVAGRP